MMFYRNFFGCQTALFWSPWNIVMMISIIVLIAAIAAVLIKKVKKPIEYSAFEELKLRLVRGEITIEEYQKQKSVLFDT